MSKLIIVFCLTALALAHAETNPLFVISQDPSIPSLLTFNDLISTVKDQHVPYLYFDIDSSAHPNAHRRTLRSILLQLPTYSLKHSSLISHQELSSLQSNMIPFSPENTYAHANISEASNKTARIEIAQNLLTPQIFEQINPRTLVILNFNSKTNRVLQSTTQTNTSPMLNAMNPSALSGILVTVFLLVVLLIAVNCLMDLKTNDRFPRSILNVGKES